MCQDVDPVWGLRARAGEVIDADEDAGRAAVLHAERPQRVPLPGGDQGRSASTRPRTRRRSPSGFPRAIDVRDFSKPDGTGSVATGQLIRMVNLGVAIHQMHFHGNHVWTVRRNLSRLPAGVRLATFTAEGHVVLQQWEDVVELDPLRAQGDRPPVRRPPDAIDEVWDARTEDWHYPMHCHAEPSQTAAGGLYPGRPGGRLGARRADAAPGTRPSVSQAEFASNQPHEGNPGDGVPPDARPVVPAATSSTGCCGSPTVPST